MISLTPRLWDPHKKGTLIISDPRAGTHFLQRTVADMVSQHQAVVRNDEIDLEPTKNWPGSVGRTLTGLAQRPEYQVAIINSVVAKNELIAHPDLTVNWHLIRLTRRDKIGWFRSWALFFLHEQSEHNQGPSGPLQHHGTSQETYLQSLASLGPIKIDGEGIKHIGGNLSLHVLCKMVPVDEEIDYDDLAALETQYTRWKANRYPEVALDRLFANWSELEPLLISWSSIDPPGQFRA